MKQDLEVAGFKVAIAKRVRRAAEIVGGPKELSERLQLSARTLNNYMNGRNEPKTSGLVKIARASGVRLEWLATGEGPMLEGDGVRTESPIYRVDADKGLEMVPRYGGATPGVSTPGGGVRDVSQGVDYLGVSRSWLDSEHLDADQLALIEARGDAMVPAVEHGDLLLVDLRTDRIADEGIYVLEIDGTVSIRRLQRMLGGQVKVVADNRLYEAQTLARDQLSELRIIGRVVWVARRI